MMLETQRIFFKWCGKHFAAPTLTNRLMTNHWAGLSVRKWKRIVLKMAAKLKEKRTSVTMVPSIFRSFANFPTHLLFHYPLPLTYDYSGQPIQMNNYLPFIFSKRSALFCTRLIQ
jgi:hypothetical protein